MQSSLVDKRWPEEWFYHTISDTKCTAQTVVVVGSSTAVLLPLLCVSVYYSGMSNDNRYALELEFLHNVNSEVRIATYLIHNDLGHRLV